MNVLTRLKKSISLAWHDTSGLMLPYVAVMLPVLMGFSMLAVDASRYMSLQTQMQAAADSLALAGARELNKLSGAQTRAVSAMANAYGSSISANSLVGMGASPTLTYTYTFYSSLNAASSGIGGVAATGDGDSKYVKVTVAPQSVSMIIPITILNKKGVNSFSTGATAVAGNQGITVCGVAPIFVCNPYENPNGSMTDAQATAALFTAFNTPSTLRKMLVITRGNNSAQGPGHFGWLETADGCNNTNCMRTNISQLGANICYNMSGVNLGTGNKNSVEQFFDTRFDIYSQNPSPALDATDPPAKNVRKGYTPGTKASAPDWCSKNTLPQAGANVSNKSLTYPAVPTTGTTTGKVTKNSTSVTSVGSTTGVVNGEPIVDAKGYLGAANTVSSVSGTTVTVGTKASNTNGGENLTIEWTAAGLPEDTVLTAFANGGEGGNGQWDCANYWAINHPGGPTAAAVGTALGGTCGTPAATTLSRYQIYRYEISNGTGAGGINDWSGVNGWTSNGKTDAQGVKNPAGNYQTENGVPYCAAASGVSAVDTTTGGLDRRNIIVPYINCMAQTALGNITGGNTANNVPVAAFGKFFLTQPYSELSDGNLYGEVTGLVNKLDNVTIFNLVQLYR